jgi:di/tricarboxylate transporter
MTFEIGLLLALTVLAVVLFSFERFSPDVVALGLVLTLVSTGLLSASKAFAGFGSDAVILILGLLILSAALNRTGVVDMTGRILLRWTGTNPTRLLIVVMLASAILGAFMSNTASTAFFLPVVIGLARKAKMSPHQLLLPLAFSSILTSSVTMISTSTNIVVSGLMQQFQMPPMGMFELTPVGVPIMIAGLIYMTFVGKWWLGRKPNADAPEQSASFREYLSEVVVLPESQLVGKTLGEARLGEELDLTVVRVVREKTEYLNPRSDLILQPNDVLLVEAEPADLLKIKDLTGLEIKADLKLADRLLPQDQLGLVEAVVLSRSPLIGRTLKGLGVRERYGVQVLGISRHGKLLRKKISLLPIRIGDIFLVQGAKGNIGALESDHAFRIIQSLDETKVNRKRAPLAIAIFILALVLGTMKVLPLHIATMLGVVLVFLTRCITPDEAYCEVEWKAVILIGAMLALGTAMDQTGTAKYLAAVLTDFFSGHDPRVLLGGFFALTVLLTQPMSNQAAAVVVLPVAIEAARHLNLNPRTFTMMIAVAASCSYLTPLEPSCLMVYGPGGYRFSDFLKIGLPLTVLIAALAIWLVPVVWPM